MYIRTLLSGVPIANGGLGCLVLAWRIIHLNRAFALVRPHPVRGCGYAGLGGPQTYSAARPIHRPEMAPITPVAACLVALSYLGPCTMESGWAVRTYKAHSPNTTLNKTAIASLSWILPLLGCRAGPGVAGAPPPGAPCEGCLRIARPLPNPSAQRAQRAIRGANAYTKRNSIVPPAKIVTKGSTGHLPVGSFSAAATGMLQLFREQRKPKSCTPPSSR